MRRLSLVLLAAVAVAGCKKPSPSAPQAAGAAPEAAPANAVQGKVLERKDAPPYSYLKLKTGSGEAWAAVPQTDVAVGQDVTVAGAMPMTDFESKTLGRKFDLVYFGTLAGPGGAPAAPAPMMGGQPGPMMGGGQGGMGAAQGQPPSPAQMAAQHAAAAQGGNADVGDVKVDKAKGADARTVAEVWAQKTALKEKPVTVRGKVVKFNANIMGKNWMHLRDGSGTAGKDNDLTVTTGDAVSVGDVVTAKGTVRTDKDFGAGYAYPVIVEDAKITK